MTTQAIQDRLRRKILRANANQRGWYLGLRRRASSDFGRSVEQRKREPLYLAERFRQAASAGPYFGGRRREHLEHGNVLRRVALNEGRECRLECRISELVYSQRTRQRILSALLHAFCAPNEDSSLRTTQKLVAGESDQVHAGGKTGLDRRLVR